MKPSDDQMVTLRSYAIQLIKEYVPFNIGDDHYKEVVENNSGWIHGKGSGTSCGFLCHWLMWRLGVSDPKVLNWNTVRGTWDTPRKDTPTLVRETTYENGANIDKIYNKKSSAFVMITRPYDHPMPKRNPLTNLLEASMGLAGPEIGDIAFIRNPNGDNTGHVFVFRRFRKMGNKVEWDTAEAGQLKEEATSGQDAFFKTRTFELTGDVHGYTEISKGVQIDTPNRKVIGWLDLSQVDYDEVRLRDALKAAAANAVRLQDVLKVAAAKL